MAESKPLSPLDTSSLSLKAIPPSSYEYDSGFSQQSFLTKDFKVTSFINKCSATITQMVHDDFNKTLNLIGDDMKEEAIPSDDPDLSSFTAKHLTATNLKQLQKDVCACYDNLKQELIRSFEANYPQFLALNESLTAGTERNLKQCQQSLDHVHKKYSAIYQQILRLLERIHSKSVLKSNYISKLNTLKQISFVPHMMEDIKRSLKTLHSDFDPFDAIHNGKSNQNQTHSSSIREFKQLFSDEISKAAPRKQYRLLQKSSRLERIAILLTKLSAIFATEDPAVMRQHLLVKNAEAPFVALRTRFYNELKDVFLGSIRSGSLLSLRSNLRCYNYLNAVSVEQIVREHYMTPLVYSCLPISIFTSASADKRTIETHFDELYTLLVDKLSILFNAEVLSQNDFIADAIWCQVVDIVLNEDYAEWFISRGLPDRFHAHYGGILRFLRKLQRLYYTEMTCGGEPLAWQVDYDQYLYYHASTVRLRKKCNLSQYFLFRMPYITRNVMQMASDAYAPIQYHFKIYMRYCELMKENNDNNNNDEDLSEYMKRLNGVKNALSDLNIVNKSEHLSLKHFEYNYALPIFQVVIIHLLQCWDVKRIWIWELSADFFKLSLQILSFLGRYLKEEMRKIKDGTDSRSNAHLLVLTHSDLYYFCEWMKHEFVPLVEQRCGTRDDNIKRLVNESMNPFVESLQALKGELLDEMMVCAMVRECDAPLVAVDELADSWQANINLLNNESDPQQQMTMLQHKVSDYVSQLFKPLQTFLMFISDHTLEHLSVKQKNELIWNVLNAICQKYWNKIKNVQQRLAQIQKIMQRRRRFRKKKKEENNDNQNNNKSGAERAEYQLFLDVRQFMQQMQGFVNGLQRDEKRMRIKMEQEEDEKQAKKKAKSSIIVFKKKKKENEEHTTTYNTDNLLCWSELTKFVDKFQ